MPTISSRCFESAARHSFFSRDNTEKFIQFCRRLGVHQHLLFESDDLGTHTRCYITDTVDRSASVNRVTVSRALRRYVYTFSFCIVLQNKPRNVVLCLMEVSRLASRFGLEPPGLVQMEKEIDAEEAMDHNGGLEVKNTCTPYVRHRFVVHIVWIN